MNNITKKEIEERILTVYDVLFQANNDFFIMQKLNHQLFADAHGKVVYKMAPVFWSNTIMAFQYKLFMALAKVCDETKSAVSIKNIINIIESNQMTYFDSKDFVINGKNERIKCNDIIKEARKLYDETAETRSRVKNIRDKDLAHIDKNVLLDLRPLYEKNLMKYEEFEKLINTLYRIIDLLVSYDFNYINPCPLSSNIDDTHMLFDNARIGAIYREEHYMNTYHNNQKE